MYILQLTLIYLITYSLVVSICFPDPNERRRNKVLIELVSILATFVIVESIERISDLGEVLGHGLN